MTSIKMFAVTALLALTHSPAFAAECVVTSSRGLNLRSRASFDSNVLLSVDPGRTVKCDPANTRNGLIKVSYRGTDGWMAANLLRQESAPAPKTNDTQGFVQSGTGRRVNVRKSPNGALTDFLKGDKRLPIIPSKSTASWYAVQLPDGSVGYVYKELTNYISGEDAPTPAPVKTEAEIAAEAAAESGVVVETQSAPIEIEGTKVLLDGNGTRVNIRSGAGTSNAIVETLSDGSEVVQTGPASNGWVPVSWADSEGHKQTGFVAERLIGKDDGTEAASADCDDGTCGQNGVTPVKLPNSEARQCMIDRLIASAKRLYGGARPKSQCAKGVRRILDDAGLYSEDTLSNWNFYGHDSKSGSENQARLMGHGMLQLGFEKVSGVDSPGDAQNGDVLVYGTPDRSHKGWEDCGGAGNRAGHTEIKVSAGRYISDGDNSVARNAMPWYCRPLIAVYRVKECKRCTTAAVNACHL